MPKRKYYSAKSKEDALNQAEAYRKKHGSLTGNSFYRLPDGEKIRIRSKDEGRLSAENVSTKDKADAKRKSFEQPSTDSAHKENSRIKNLNQTLNKEGKMMGLGGVRNEHIVDQFGADSFTAGSSGDPGNQIPVRESDALYKNKLAKWAAKNNFVVTLNPTTDSFRLIQQDNFDPLVDPTDLPGFDVAPETNLKQFESHVKLTNGGMRFKATGIGALAGLVSSEEAMTKAFDGDYAGAIQSAGKEMIVGEGISQIIQKAAPQVAKYAPKVVGGAMKLAPFLAPVSAVTTGITVGNVLADNAKKRREDNPNLTRNTQYSYNDAFMHGDDNPVTIQAN